MKINIHYTAITVLFLATYCIGFSQGTYVNNGIIGQTCVNEPNKDISYTINFPNTVPANATFTYTDYSVFWSFNSNYGSFGTNSNANSMPVNIKWLPVGDNRSLTATIFYYEWQNVGTDEYGYDIMQYVLVAQEYSTLDIQISPTFYSGNNFIFSPLANTANPNLQFPFGEVLTYTYNYNTVPHPLAELFPPSNISSLCEAPTYQWESSNSLNGPYTTVVGANSSTYTFNTSLQQTTFFRRKLFGSNGYTAVSNSVKVEIVSINWEDRNYVREHNVLISGVTNWRDVDQLQIGTDGKTQTTTYIDGIGRNIQSVAREMATPTSGSLWGDVVNFFNYDEFGRQSKQYLPFTTVTESGRFKTSAYSEQTQFYNNKFNDNFAYSEITFDNSPLNRIINSKEPGSNYNNSNGSTLTYDFNNATDDVKIISVGLNSGDLPIVNGLYNNNTLLKTIITKPDGKKVIEIYNNTGQLILKKIQLDDNPSLSYEGWMCIYNIYDDFGMLRYTLQPEAVKFFSNNGWVFNGSEALQVLKNLCFNYEYDDKQRNTLKRAPGAKELLMLYDKRDRLVFTQDGNQRAKVPQEWTANLYDELDRVTLTTLYRPNKTKDDLIHDISQAVAQIDVTMNLPGQPVQNLVVDHHVLSTHYYTAQNNIEFIAGAGGNFETTLGDDFVAEITSNAVTPGYNVTVTTLNNPISSADLNNTQVTTILKYLFYDHYNFTNVKSFSSNYDNITAYPATTSNVLPINTTNRTVNMITGDMVRVLGTNTFLASTNYYDEQGNIIQTLSDNIKSGLDIVTNQYHFDGRLLSTSVKHTTLLTGYNNFPILTKYNFDKIGRTISIDKAIGSLTQNPTFKTIVSYEYDDFSRIKTKHLAPGYSNTTTGKNEMESLTYSYDINNHIVGINKDYALKTAGVYNKWNNYFGLSLGFDKTEGVYTGTNLNSLVSGVAWSTQGDDAQRKYDFSYDNAGRLINAQYNEKQKTADNWSHSKFDFSVSGRNGKILYDLNGNILFMKQMGVLPGNATPVVIDDLEYYYTANSNKLNKVTDASTLGNNNGRQGDFKDGTNNADDYVYDENGNLIIDLNKSVKDLSTGSQNTALGNSGIKYNFLDKPEEIRIAGKGVIKIIYDAYGNKLQKIYTPENSSIPKITSYINQFVYEENNLQYIGFEEGRIRAIQKTNLNNGFDLLNIDGSMDLPAGKRGVFDYFIRDYLGNVRMILTEETHTGSVVCTMEENRQPNETPVFGKVLVDPVTQAITIPSDNEVLLTQFPASSSHWPSNTNGYVSKLGKLANSKIGPNTLLRVMAGDVINATTQYYYQNPVTNTSNGSGILTSVLTSLTNAISTSNVASGFLHGQASTITNPLGGNGLFGQQISPDNATTDDKAKAYIVALFFDEQFNFIAEGSYSKRVGAAGEDILPLLDNNGNSIKAPKNGYAFVYVSNESDEHVYFDNFQVSHYHARIVEENHYYAYGLKIAGISSRKMYDINEGNIQNKYLYNDKELWDEADLNWYDYGFRNYDPQIGRFPQLDPLTFEYPFLTNYQYASCEPIGNIDVDGLEGQSALEGSSSVTVFSTLKRSIVFTPANIVYTSLNVTVAYFKYEGPTGHFLVDRNIGQTFTQDGETYDNKGLIYEQRAIERKMYREVTPVSSVPLSDNMPQLSQSRAVTPYEAAINAARVKNGRLNAGLNPETGRARFTFGEHWDKANDRIVEPIVEGLASEVGIRQAAIGVKYLGSFTTKSGSSLLSASEKYVVIGKYPDYINFASKYKNASVLDLPNKWAHLPKQEAAKFLWKQNSSQLRGALRNGYIPYDIGYGGRFYNAEKLILGNKGLSLQGNIWIK